MTKNGLIIAKCIQLLFSLQPSFAYSSTIAYVVYMHFIPSSLNCKGTDLSDTPLCLQGAALGSGLQYWGFVEKKAVAYAPFNSSSITCQHSNYAVGFSLSSSLSCS